MTPPIPSVVSLQAYQPQARDESPATPSAPPAASTARAPSAPLAASAPSAREPVVLSVDRDDSGVFVYTLTDRASGRVIAVIPRSAVVQARGQAPAAGVDIQA